MNKNPLANMNISQYVETNEWSWKYPIPKEGIPFVKEIIEYYTPSIEDIHVGYKCEVYGQSTTKLIKNVSFHEVKVGLHIEVGKSVGINQIPNLIKKGYIRTPYLTKEQIEKEGWVYKSSNGVRYWFEKLDMFIDAPHSPSHQILAAELIHDPEYNTIQIKVKLRSDFEYHTFFEGNCPSINEFRKIVKLLGIVK